MERRKGKREGMGMGNGWGIYVLRNRIFIPHSPFIPVLWDPFISRLVLEISRFARDAEKGLEGRVVEGARGVLGGLVGH